MIKVKDGPITWFFTGYYECSVFLGINVLRLMTILNIMNSPSIYSPKLRKIVKVFFDEKIERSKL